MPTDPTGREGHRLRATSASRKRMFPKDIRALPPAFAASAAAAGIFSGGAAATASSLFFTGPLFMGPPISVSPATGAGPRNQNAGRRAFRG